MTKVSWVERLQERYTEIVSQISTQTILLGMARWTQSAYLEQKNKKNLNF